MSGSKLVSLSLLCGIVITGVVTWIALSIGNEKISTVLLWNVVILVRLAGRGPLLGYDAEGNPMHEGTPVHLLAGVFGLLLGIPIYSVVSYFVLRAITCSKSRGQI